MHNFEPGQKVVVKCNTLKGNDENRINRRKVARKARFLDRVNGFYLVEIMKNRKPLYKECIWSEDIMGVLSK
ncbi:hypothetical protein CPJCM30710_25370 [Clostridium polyendosporum]|uniref:Uncharacterized protein n=1 Tax=Clostridium polyendosporum TaxID=69208 RepID=A0A919S0T9_9CLOT|nr:hypothetical protein [Clostridium polyendosporum]GIM29871.1 hypothetical protein CPJCM30710_25370 [Clostridium polyendosporum]